MIAVVDHDTMRTVLVVAGVCITIAVAMTVTGAGRITITLPARHVLLQQGQTARTDRCLGPGGRGLSRVV